MSEDKYWLPAHVPGCVHTDLIKNGKIEDPFYGKNELGIQWIDKKDWEYATTFDLDPQLVNAQHVELEFAGLDTYAEVYLNNEHILSADNMFRTWKVDVKKYVKERENKLRVYFRSPIKEDLPKLEQLGYQLPAANDHSEDGELGDKRVSIFARKAPYHYGWDWGPRFVTSGIWKEVKLVAWEELHITDLYIRQDEISKSAARVTAMIDIEANDSWEGTLKLTTDGISIEQYVTLYKGLNQLEIPITIENPKLWWSRGLGEQHFYFFTLSCEQTEKIVAEKTVRTGLRTINVIRENDASGQSFYFELNGVPIFTKGANHIPNDSFVTEVTYDRYKHEIVSATEANMNMLRVWGGGIYEYDAFYELCDEHGILVWQDFMFACSMYPGKTEFLASVKAEAIDTVKRLRNHPCMAIWCGNNEIDSAWAHFVEDAGWGWKQDFTNEQREKIWSDYEAIFHELLPSVVESLAPDVFYWPSSPMQAITNNEDQHATTTSTKGDIHYWEVWHMQKPFSEYNTHVGRYMSEYGFQSFPELKTVKSYTPDNQLAWESDVMLHHQKNGDGNFLIKQYMDMYLPEPKDFPSFLYMSHVLQAEGIKSAIEAHRRHKPFCMGTLYWQMNDCWPVASWSSMDYYGRWKALHYFVKKSFKDVVLSIDGTDEEKVHIHLISDSIEDVLGTLDLHVMKFDGETIFSTTRDVKVKGNTAQNIYSVTIEDFIKEYERNDIVLVAKLITDKGIIDVKEHYFVHSKDLQLVDPEVKVKRLSDSEFALTSNVLAKNVYLEAEEEGIFTDNYFDLLPGETKVITFKELGKQSFVPKRLDTLHVSSMLDHIK
ncbi:glycoside hydrolase family 2 protein [Halalkalibacter sp. APA_J-10(15)]|uniref:beta-mannosidase n=1 Tax=Halalkalibacter sp. APA_J-10(15) TaxID=2933805 RepID=UPI001FF3932B|nr:glycoside hydrolase family 2 protein [Halalkalibacter sp. APA_J-10(15)]MCK0472212.1 glycoside hydrolase family 2 protein [Halalkalibacter sp. APA_J-10(15)]